MYFRFCPGLGSTVCGGNGSFQRLVFLPLVLVWGILVLNFYFLRFSHDLGWTRLLRFQPRCHVPGPGTRNLFINPRAYT